MLQLEQLKQNRKLINAVDWDMTPEEAVRLYLEWGNNWAGGNYVIRSKNDVTHYFVINTWKDTPRVYLVRRNSEEARELAEFELPADIRKRFLESVGYQKGVYPVSGEVANWLKRELIVS